MTKEKNGNLLFHILFYSFFLIFDRDLASLSRSYKWLCRGDICYCFSIWPQGGAVYTHCWAFLSLLSFVVITEHCCHWWDCLYFDAEYCTKRTKSEILNLKSSHCIESLVWIAVLDLKSIFSLVWISKDNWTLESFQASNIAILIFKYSYC